MVKGYVVSVERRKEEEPSKEEEPKALERFPFGIEKLDEAIEGGVPVGSWVVISGMPGTGKTVLTQHATYSALKNDYRVVYVSIEQKFWEWLTQAKLLGLNVDSYPIVKLDNILSFDSKTKKFVLDFDKAPENFRVAFIDIYSLVSVARYVGVQKREEGRRKWYSYLDVEVLSTASDLAFRLFAENPEEKRLKFRHKILFVVDSLSVFYLRAPSMAGKVALDLSLRFKRNNVVGLLTTHYAQTTSATFGFRVEHVADGILHLWMDNVEATKEVKRYLIIKKMRMTQHSLKAFKVFIEKGKGMRVEPLE